MVCSRSGVHLYAATRRSGPGLLCAAARSGFAVLKKNLSLLEGLDFTPAASATTKGDRLCTYLVRIQNFNFNFPFDEIYRRLLFFTRAFCFRVNRLDN